MDRAKLAAPLLALVASGGAAAREQERVLESARFLGRGNTYVAATDSDEATRGNPATLAEPAKLAFQLRFVQLDLFAGSNTLDSIGDVASIDGESSAVSMLDTFRDKFGKRQFLRAQLAPLAMRIYSFEVAPFVSTTNWVDLRLPTLPEVQLESDTLTGASVSYAFAIGKTTTVGATVRPAHRQRFSGAIDFSTLLEFVDSDDMGLDDVFKREEGFVVGLDLGLVWKPTKEWRFALLGENLGFADDQGDFKDPPPPLAQRLSAGLAYRMDLKPWAWDFFADLQDVVNPRGYDWFRLLHLGTELGRSYVSRDLDVGVQLGLNEGYVSTGAFVDLYVFRLNLAYYAVELGEYAGQRSDRRWGLTLLSAMTF